MTAASCLVGRWWVLGDLVLSGHARPRFWDPPVIAAVEMLRGNPDRYVLTGESPPARNRCRRGAKRRLVERYGLMAAGIGWPAASLARAGLHGDPDDPARQLRLGLPDGQLAYRRARVR